ncbi:MAG: VOC family protein [Bacillota bacterium]|nr:VOC family protein [Bacillota bacterium]
MQNIKYVHTNLIAKDWKSLSKFYIEVFGCKPTYPERDLSGDWIDKITEIKGARQRGIHLSLPGYENGPTLEIFEYSPENLRSSEPSINMQGFGHIAFHVDDVEEILKTLITHGGKHFGEVVRKEYPELGLLTAAYTKDPEGNFIELQNWKK